MKRLLASISVLLIDVTSLTRESREVGAAQFWSFLPVSSFNVMNSVRSSHEICFRIWRRRGDSNSRYP